MRYKVLFGTIFVLVAFFIAFAIKPKTKEMVYVYEKSNNLQKLNKEYEKIVEEKPDDLELLKKLVDNSYKLRNEKYLELSITYYKQKKDYEIIRRIIDAYKMKKEFNKALEWIEIAYTDFNKIEDLNEIIAISSSSNKTDLLILNLKRLYLRTNKTEILFTLYGLNEKEYALERIYTLMENKQLNNEEYEKGIILAIFEKELDIAYNFYSKKSLNELNILKFEKEYYYMLANLYLSDEIVKLNQHLYKITNNEKYYKKLTDLLIYEGDIEKYLEITKKRYTDEKRVSDLNDLIKYNYLNENIENYLEYLGKKVILEKDIKTAESIIAYYIDLNDEKSLKSFLNELNNISKRYDEFKDLTLRTYAYLNMHEIAEKILLTFSPKDVSANVVYSVFKRKINEKSMPYFMEVLKNSNDKVTKGKLFRYRYKTLRLFTDDTYKYFGKPSTFKKLYSYIELFSDKDKYKNLLKFADKSIDPMFISETAQYFLFKNRKEEAITLFQKAISIYPYNKLSLKTLASIYLYDNKKQEAFTFLKRVKEIDKLDIEIDYYLAEYYYLTNNTKLYKEYYTKVINNLEKKSLKEEFLILRAKSKIDSPVNYIDEFSKLIADSNNDINLISDIWYIFYENKQYNYLIKEFNKFKEIIKTDSRLQDIEISTYMALDKNKIAKDKINSLLKENRKNSNLSILYERLAAIEYKEFDKVSALKNYKKSLSLSYSKDKEEITNNLKKEFRTKLNTTVGVRSDIKEIHFEFRELIKKVKANLKYDSFDDYDSSKIELTDLNEKYLLGFGKDYFNIKFQHIFNSNLALNFEKNIDTASKLTIEDRLKFEKISMEYSNSFEQTIFYNLKLDYYKYDNFNRKKWENNLYIPFNKTYFANISYIYENVNNQNIYGYETENRYTLSIGENFKVNDYINYYYSIGGENDEKETTYFINFDLYYNNRDYDISIKNSFSKDPLNSDYNFNSMLNFAYYF